MAAVLIIWSTTNGGSSTSEPFDHGNNASSSITSGQTIFVRHTGTNQITNCALYMREFAGTTADGDTYSGDFSPIEDYNEVVSWGDAVTSSGFGGFQVNMNATGDFPDSSWPTLANKTTADGQGYVARTGTGISAGTAVTLTPETGCSSSGVIPAGNSNVRFQARIQMPSSITTAGVRMFESVLSFTYTS